MGGSLSPGTPYGAPVVRGFARSHRPRLPCALHCLNPPRAAMETGLTSQDRQVPMRDLLALPSGGVSDSQQGLAGVAKVQAVCTCAPACVPNLALLGDRCGF